ncbi:MAG: DUF5069 domain-containing protein [Nanoarchaeota archaeon]|nr:DUF5069 domain-containing protein [Nanoarchaeota archaeon]|tara:strand:+ start:1085 stop:1495 length:411 start_codon:yes stop_codon:yes gene_type:complete
MDLTNNFPRSPYDMNADLVMLPRTTDKAIASNEGTLGEYSYNCPLDQKLFTFLGVDAETFASKVKEFSNDDKKIAEWVNSEFSKTQEEKNDFNNKARHNAPEDEESKQWLEEQKKALNRDDYSTYFDNIDADEKRF